MKRYIPLRELTEPEKRLRRLLRQKWVRARNSDPVKRARRQAFNRKHQAEIRAMASLLGHSVTSRYPRLPSGPALIEALHARALFLLDHGAPAEVVYPVWAMWKTVQRLQWLREAA